MLKPIPGSMYFKLMGLNLSLQGLISITDLSLTSYYLVLALNPKANLSEIGPWFTLCSFH